MTQKIDFESQNFAIFDKFTQLTARLKKFLRGLVVGFGPKRRLGIMCNSVC